MGDVFWQGKKKIQIKKDNYKFVSKPHISSKKS